MANLLEGIRIVDLSMGWAGPLAARHLADMGAQVIKVESCTRFDWWRSWEATPEWIADNGAEKALAYLYVNRNKLDITLDLEDETGRDLLLQLVAISDAVIENYSGGVLPKLKLDYAHLKQANKQIVMVSMPAFGSTGPWAEFRAYGSTIEHSSGLPHLQGSESDPPTMQHVAFGDAIAGLNGAAALLTALWHKNKTGEGQFVDLNQAECLFPLGAHGILEFATSGKNPTRYGNDHPAYSPHGVYPCLGDDRWILIQVLNENQWQAFKDLSSEEFGEFGNLKDRLQRRAALNRAIATWTSGQDATELMHKLQHSSIPAAELKSALDLLTDPNLAQRNYLQWLDREHVGMQPHPSAPYRNGPEPLSIRTPAPTLGQHNEEILGDLLGADTAQLEASGVIGTKPRMPS